MDPRTDTMAGLEFGTKAVGVDGGVELAYLDSGAPLHPAVYPTLVLVHGIHFTSAIFKHLLRIAPGRGVRVVAVNRRGCHPSTPPTKEETNLLSQGADDRAAFLRARGLELASFVDTLIRDGDLSEPGGVVLIGWSLGSMLTCAAISSVALLPTAVKECLRRHLRAHILEDAPSIALGLPLPSQIYSPQLDDTIPKAERHERFLVWISAYSQHRDLSGEEPSCGGIEYMHPSASREPSINRISAEDRAAILDMRPELVQFDNAMMFDLYPDILLASFRGAIFDTQLKLQLPRMKVVVLVGEASISFPITALWSMKALEKETGEKHVDRYEIVPGVNHFMHWDNPDETLDAFLRDI